MKEKYTLFCDSVLIESSDDLSHLINRFHELEVDCKDDVLIMDNHFDMVVYG